MAKVVNFMLCGSCYKKKEMIHTIENELLSWGHKTHSKDRVWGWGRKVIISEHEGDIGLAYLEETRNRYLNDIKFLLDFCVLVCSQNPTIFKNIQMYII